MKSQKIENQKINSEIPAGEFLNWFEKLEEALKNDGEAEVPCGECRACCHSSYFIHIKPTDSMTLEHVPKQLVFPAPGLPKGHMLLGYDEDGRCPMFVDNACSIYAYRPQTCRQYDCRVFPATGLNIDAGKSLIASQSRRWKFSLDTDQDIEVFNAVQAVARFLNQHTNHFPENFLPSNVTQQAVLAIKLYRLFLNADSRQMTVPEMVNRVVSTLE